MAKQFVYVVKAGDSALKIATKFKAANRLSELIAINTQIPKRRVSDGAGGSQTVFADLLIGQKILIPGGWIIGKTACEQVGGKLVDFAITSSGMTIPMPPYCAPRQGPPVASSDNLIDDKGSCPSGYGTNGHDPYCYKTKPSPMNVTCPVGYVYVNGKCVQAKRTIPTTPKMGVSGSGQIGFGEGCSNDFDCSDGLVCLEGACDTPESKKEYTNPNCVRTSAGCDTNEECCSGYCNRSQPVGGSPGQCQIRYQTNISADQAQCEANGGTYQAKGNICIDPKILLPVETDKKNCEKKIANGESFYWDTETSECLETDTWTECDSEETIKGEQARLGVPQTGVWDCVSQKALDDSNTHYTSHCFGDDLVPVATDCNIPTPAKKKNPPPLVACPPGQSRNAAGKCAKTGLDNIDDKTPDAKNGEGFPWAWVLGGAAVVIGGGTITYMALKDKKSSSGSSSSNSSSGM